MSKIMYMNTEYAAALSVSQLTVTLSASGWANYSQTVTATGVTANNSLIVSAAPSSVSDYVESGIVCTIQSYNSLTFTCTSVPSTDIAVNVLILT